MFMSLAERFPIRKSELDRFKFGKKKVFMKLQVKKQMATLSVLTSLAEQNHFPKPMSYVTCMLNLFQIRSMKKLVTGGKPFVICSCYSLPFKDKAFDFVTSYYLIEHRR